jgi:hypothetical protein
MLPKVGKARSSHCMTRIMPSIELGRLPGRDRVADVSPAAGGAFGTSQLRVVTP